MPLHIIEALLNHQSETISDIAKIHNRYDYMKEMTDAVQRYEVEITDVIGNGMRPYELIGFGLLAIVFSEDLDPTGNKTFGDIVLGLTFSRFATRQ
jgi:hypothetical protein